MIVESTMRVLGSFPSFPQSVVREEVSQPRVGVAEAMSGGPIHRAFIAALPEAWRSDPTVEIFSRALYLKQGWYPLTPHFHFDWGRGADSATVETLMVCLGDASLTEFILGPLEHPEDRARPGDMHRWDGQVAAGLRAGTLRSCRIEPEKLILFDNRSLHRARPATRTGWRLLVRAIRGLSAMDERSQDGGYGKRSAFTTSRNGFVPETDDEQARYQPYRE
jgi:hypothetical protein